MASKDFKEKLREIMTPILKEVLQNEIKRNGTLRGSFGRSSREIVKQNKNYLTSIDT